VNNFLGPERAGVTIYLYPTVFTQKDWIYLIYFKFFKRYPFYCDINELRVASALLPALEKGLFHRVKSKIKASLKWIPFKLSELQSVFCDGIVVISTNLEEYFSRYNTRILRIPILCDGQGNMNGDNFPKYADNIFKICFAGYIKCAKEGFDILFEALAKVNVCRQVELYLYGILPDEEKLTLESLVERFSLERKIFYMGNVDPDDLQAEFTQYHLLILPRSHTRQAVFGFSTKLAEYLLSGVPVLITDVSDNGLFIKDGYNGFIIPPGSSLLMADKIMDVIDNYNLNASKIAENARVTARENFDFRLFTDRFIDFLFSR